MLEDLWPEIDDFEQVNNRIEEKRRLQSESKSLKIQAQYSLPKREQKSCVSKKKKSVQQGNLNSKQG